MSDTKPSSLISGVQIELLPDERAWLNDHVYARITELTLRENRLHVLPEEVMRPRMAVLQEERTLLENMRKKI